MAKLRILRSSKIIEGAAFSDYIYTERTRRKNHNMGKNNSMRVIFLFLLLFVVVLVLFGRTFYLQIIKGFYYRRLSDNNRIKTVVIHAPRGIIFDRNGVPLVYNMPGFREEVDEKTRLLTQ